MEVTWQDPAWLASAHEWVDAEIAIAGLHRTGAITQPHLSPTSTVLRVPTDVGSVWFKANVERLRYEAALVRHLATRRPDCVPPLMAADVDRGWMLMADAGRQLRAVVAKEKQLERWLDVLPVYADLQIDLAGDVDTLLSLGVPDLRLLSLPDLYAQLLDGIHAPPRFRSAVPQVREWCAELAAYHVQETIQHDDLHDGQVFERGGRYYFLDWADACISHPFFTLAVTLEGGLAWGVDDIEGSLDTAPFRDAYLAPYVEIHGADLVDASRIALRLGWVCRAVNGHEAGEEERTLVRLRMFLDGHT
jgi:hypothetical protein